MFLAVMFLAGMSSPGRLLSEEQFSCSICLEVFVEPVSTPCGHSFCKACLQGYWNHSKKFVCPMCKKSYSKKPEMSVNRVLAEISTQFQGLTMSGGAASGGSTMNVSSDAGRVASPGPDTGEFARTGDVPCDACIGRKLKAHKSCLNCPGSFCETHLRHHKKVPVFDGSSMNVSLRLCFVGSDQMKCDMRWKPGWCGSGKKKEIRFSLIPL